MPTAALDFEAVRRELQAVLASLLFGVAPSDPATFGGVALLLSAVVLAACVIPARSALRVDPNTALRD